MDQYGRLKINFTDIMNTTLGYKELNSSNCGFNDSKQNISEYSNLMEIYVIPAKERHLYDEWFELQQVNLTWAATNYSRSTLDI